MKILMVDLNIMRDTKISKFMAEYRFISARENNY